MLKRKSTMDAPPPDHPAPPLSPVEQYYYKPRRNPWPYVAIVVALVALGWAFVAWHDDGGVVNAENAASKLGDSNPALPAAGGLTSDDLSGCFTFQSGASGPSNILDAAGDPAAKSLADAGVFTKEIVDGYINAVDGSVAVFEDKTLLELLNGLKTDLGKLRDQAVAAEAAGEEGWGSVMPDVRTTLKAFGKKFEKRCDDGGVLVNVVPDE